VELTSKRLKRVELIAYHQIMVPLAFLPAPLAYGIAVLRGDFHYWLDKSSREVITFALEHILGNHLSTEERSRVVRDFFRLRSCETVDAMRLAGNGRALARLVETRGFEHIEAALSAGKGAILCSAHFGSFRCCFSLLGSFGLPISLIANWSYDEDSNLSPIRRWLHRSLRNWPVVPHLYRPNILRRKGRFGIAPQVAILLRQNELVGAMLDHSDYGDPAAPTDRARPVMIDFLNGQSQLLGPGVITIAQLTGAPVLMMFMRRSADWRHQVLEVFPTVEMEGDSVAVYRRCLAVVEAAIRRDPAHWMGWIWAHKLGLLPVEDSRSRDLGEVDVI